jgi:hypothetical protein
VPDRKNSAPDGEKKFPTELFSLLLAIFIVLAGFTFERLIHEFSWAIYLSAFALAALTAICASFICRIQIDEAVKGITSRVQDEVKSVLKDRLGVYADELKTLKKEVISAASKLQASNPKSDLRQVLLSAEDICDIEANAKDKIYVVTQDLAFDEKIGSVVLENLRRNIEYVYFYIDRAISEGDISDFIHKLALNNQMLRYVKFVSIPKSEFSSPVDLVIYDPDSTKRSGYLRLPSEVLGDLRAVKLSPGDRLHNLSERLTDLLKRYDGNQPHK